MFVSVPGIGVEIAQDALLAPGLHNTQYGQSNWKRQSNVQVRKKRLHLTLDPESVGFVKGRA